jgi:acyl-CoA thioester hydrolase
MNKADPMSRPFRYRFRVRCGECDAQKVVFNARYGDYIDLAVLEFFRALGFAATLFDGPLDYQVVKLLIEWKGSARFDQVLEATVATARTGNTSFGMSVEFRIAGEEPIIATAETVYVLIDARTMSKATLPDELRVALERGLPDVVVDHSGNDLRGLS